MAQINFGGVEEKVVTREEFPLEKAREVLRDETIAVIGYGVQGPGQSLNLKDNGFNVIVGQREGSKSWETGLLTRYRVSLPCDGVAAPSGAFFNSVRIFIKSF